MKPFKLKNLGPSYPPFSTVSKKKQNTVGSLIETVENKMLRISPKKTSESELFLTTSQFKDSTLIWFVLFL